MSTLNCFLLAVIVGSIFAVQNKFRLVQENVALSYLDKKLADATAGIYKLNRTINALNVTAKIKFNVPDDFMGHVATFRWANGGYQPGHINLGREIKSVMEMQAFGLDTIFQEYTRPPVGWPVQKGVTYRCLGWSPDASRFPANLPEGRWKVELTFAFANKTRVAVANWFGKIVYDK